MQWLLWPWSRQVTPRLTASVLVVALALPASFALSRASMTPHAAAAPAGAVAQATYDPHVAMGALDFITFGCENCHGLYGRGGVRVPNISGNVTIPALNTATIRAALTPAALRAIIQHGVVVQSGTGRVYMPVWGAVLSDQQVADLIAYIRAGMPAVPGIVPQVVRTDLGPAVEGQQLYIRYGCVVCHAFNGFGGVPNPSSPDKTIPPLRGAAFDQQFAKDSTIAYVIKHGSILGGAPMVSMPVWGGLLSDQQIAAIIAYIRTFR
jgi:mono/diheme cytochrome c family protein